MIPASTLLKNAVPCPTTVYSEAPGKHVKMVSAKQKGALAWDGTLLFGGRRYNTAPRSQAPALQRKGSKSSIQLAPTLTKRRSSLRLQYY
mgnify:CR=1 FL=1